MNERVEYVRTDDSCLLWTASAGDGVPVVLCHGGPGLWDYLDPVSDMIKHSAATHRWDQRDGGRSSVVPPYTIERFVADLETLRAHFHHEQWIVAGHSWGATLALEYALRYPARTLALIYIGGIGIGTEWRPAYYAEREARLRAAGDLARWNELHSRDRTPEEERELCVITWATDYVDGEHGKRPAAEMLAPGFLPNYEVNAVLKDALDGESTMMERCASLHAPVLIVHGDTDPRPPSAVASLARSLPNATEQVVTGAGHLPWVEQPAVVGEALRSFIARLSV